MVDRRAEGGAPGAASSRPSSCGGSARPQTATGRLSAAANGDALASRAPGGGAQAKASACSSAAAVTASGSRWRTAGAAAASVFAASASRVEKGSCQWGLAKGFRKRLLKKEAAYRSSRREAERPTDAMNGRCMLARTVGQPQMVISPGEGAGRRCAPGHHPWEARCIRRLHAFSTPRCASRILCAGPRPGLPAAVQLPACSCRPAGSRAAAGSRTLPGPRRAAQRGAPDCALSGRAVGGSLSGRGGGPPTDPRRGNDALAPSRALRGRSHRRWLLPSSAAVPGAARRGAKTQQAVWVRPAGVLASGTTSRPACGRRCTGSEGCRPALAPALRPRPRPPIHLRRRCDRGASLRLEEGSVVVGGEAVVGEQHEAAAAQHRRHHRLDSVTARHRLRR